MRNYTNAEIAEIAYSYLQDGENTQLPISIENIILMEGIKIRDDASMDNEVIGKITFEGTQAVISVNPNENTYIPRRRFTLAHEFGHFVLHSSSGQREFIDLTSAMYRTDVSSIYEVEANHFAACILMPKTVLIDRGIELIESYGNDKQHPSLDEFIRQLALEFRVSVQSMRFRLAYLGIINN